MRLDKEPTLLTEPKEGVPEVIDSLEAFEECCERFAQAQGSVAADAERASGYRYGHEDWLVQFKRDGAGIALIDPMAIAADGGNWEVFNEAVGDATFILHDGRQDLPGFAQLGIRPRRLFDTEIAARLLGLHRFGLASVTEHFLSVTLAKEHSAADWSYRPLPRDWRNYAALDVEMLIELEQIMTKELKAHGKWEWAQEEFSHALNAWLVPPVPRSIPWMHISHINDIQNDPQGLAIAKKLWTKRDELAREFDISPSLLLADSAIIEAAQRKPRNAREFRAVRSLNERVRMHLGNEQDKMYERYAPIQRRVKPSIWKQEIQEALTIPQSKLTPLKRIPMNDDAGGNAPKSMKQWQKHHPQRYLRLMACKELIAQVSQDTATPPEMLLKPQTLRNLCWTDEPQDRNVALYLEEQGARPWQIALLAPSLTRVIIGQLPSGQNS